DNGTHTFTNGVTLQTAGSQTVTVTDDADSSVSGSATVTVSNVTQAGTHLAFLQKPASAAAGSPISPAVTVEVLDGNNNVVTTDHSDQVTLALGANPGGGTLRGTTTVTVSGGVATFGNLSVNKTGSGYTLQASSNGLGTAASGPFTIS